MIKKALIFAMICIALGSLLTFFIMRKSAQKNEVVPDTELIQQQMKNVSKLVVNEAKIAQIYNYKDEKSFMNLLSFDKKALVVVNADVQIMYDLSKLEYTIDEANKIVKITSIPKEELKISPEIKIYDVEESRFNAFEGADYNIIQESVTKQFHEKISQSNIRANAQNRLLSELSKFLVVTQSLGWQLQYQNQTIANTEDLNNFLPL
ncbi:DUF4230 domain-containing protein [Flavobacterium sp. CBA20B-1]|uniref:DUF4230 domain-containing protein n=1 Tax=unclassified Flavobacterium TaxID=196869 RepID=UPI00222542E4|nr:MULTISPECIES: DUF4230 domain-containing protein [unclassified Flavobacterium]WCM40925.1 DUF4230 domain-containing protein [Flavobacterium sp. CBA20B-1]